LTEAAGVAKQGLDDIRLVGNHEGIATPNAVKTEMRDRVIGALIAGAIAVVTTGIMAIAGTLTPPSVVIASAVGAAIGAWLAPSLRDGNRGRLMGVGGLAGFLELPGFGLIAGLGRFGVAVATGEVAIADALVAFAGILLHPVLYVIFGFQAVLVLVPAGIAWALSTHVATRGDVASAHGVST
jgi:hypothetical protein